MVVPVPQLVLYLRNIWTSKPADRPRFRLATAKSKAPNPAARAKVARVMGYPGAGAERVGFMCHPPVMDEWW